MINRIFKESELEHLLEETAETHVHDVHFDDACVDDEQHCSIQKVNEPIDPSQHTAVLLYTECIDQLLPDAFCDTCSISVAPTKKCVGTALVVVWVSSSPLYIYCMYVLLQC